MSWHDRLILLNTYVKTLASRDEQLQKKETVWVEAKAIRFVLESCLICVGMFRGRWWW